MRPDGARFADPRLTQIAASYSSAPDDDGETMDPNPEDVERIPNPIDPRDDER